jgi:hypothetical protein
MRHAYLYAGAYELNYSDLRPGTSTYRTTDGEPRPLPAWPDDIDGVRLSYMERSGKKFFVVRVQYADDDIVLETPVHVERMRHLGNKRLSADATVVTDALASAMLDDIIASNPDKASALGAMISRINIERRRRREDSGVGN